MKKQNEQLKEEMEAIAKSLEPRYKSEIEAVKRLGEQIGYGNMMRIASALWALSLKQQYGIISGALIPTIGGFMKKREAVKAEKQLTARVEYFEKMGIGEKI